jgi:hypothetical protein
MGIETMQDELKEALKILAEIASEIKVINEKIKRFDTMDERVGLLERNESRNDGGISSIKTMFTVCGALILSAIGWLYHTTYDNNNNVLLLTQRMGNIEQIIQQEKETINATHK